jgi:release factor glutamine methyltransferase
MRSEVHSDQTTAYVHDGNPELRRALEWQMNFARRVLKSLLQHSVRPIVARYLRAPRHTRYRNFSFDVPAEVFHPSLFFSSTLLADHLCLLDLRGKRLLDVGSGAGILGIVAASRGASVTAVDISADAVIATAANAKKNGVDVEVLNSDLFNELSGRRFDLIVVNPPFYPGDPKSVADHAWHAGANFEYFVRFFSGARELAHWILMVLSDECDLERIRHIAQDSGWQCSIVQTRRTLWEKDYIIELKSNDRSEQEIQPSFRSVE